MRRVKMNHRIYWNQLELAEHIRRRIEENPVLKGASWTREFRDEPVVQYGRERFPAFRNYEEFQQRTGRGMKAFRWLADREGDLHEGLRRQLQKSGLAHGSYVACDFLISMVDEDGYLQFDEEQVMAVCHVTPWELELAEGMLKSMEPIGVGSRNQEECRQLQQEAGCLVEPRPGIRYRDRKMEAFVVPDIIVKCWNDQVMTYVNVSGSPMPLVDNRYRSLIPDLIEDREKMRQLSACYQDAKELVSQMEERIQILGRLGAAMGHTNRPFFQGRAAAPSQVPLLRIGSEMGVPPAVLREVVQGKYLEFHRQLYSLEYLLQDPGKYKPRGRNRNRE